MAGKKRDAPPPKPVRKTARSAGTPDFTPVFDRLRALLTPYAPDMVVVKDDAEWYYLDTKAIGKNKKPIGFAAVRKGKAFVGFYLMPIYMNEPLQARLSPALLKRKQGKACFNFAAIDEGLFAELDEVLREGHACFHKLGYT